MIIQAFPSGVFDTNAYVVGCEQTRQVCIIDPAPESAEKLFSFIAEHHLIPKAIWLTHSHWDHIGDVAPVKAHYHIPVYVHPLDAPNLENPGADHLPCWIDIEGVTPDHLLHEDEKITVGNLEFTVIHTPGHTPGGVCFYCPQQAVLMSGDTLFKNSIGNISFPTSSPEAMWPSLAKLAKLPPATRVFPGHGPSTTIGGESWLPLAKQYFGNQ